MNNRYDDAQEFLRYIAGVYIRLSWYAKNNKDFVYYEHLWERTCDYSKQLESVRESITDEQWRVIFRQICKDLIKSFHGI